VINLSLEIFPEVLDFHDSSQPARRSGQRKSTTHLPNTLNLSNPGLPLFLRVTLLRIPAYIKNGAVRTIYVYISQIAKRKKLHIITRENNDSSQHRLINKISLFFFQ
jgi:hypothetical protein